MSRLEQYNLTDRHGSGLRISACFGYCWKMTGVMDMQYGALERMLINSIKEVQIKLGYEKEPIRFYYPQHALTKILKVSEDSDREMKATMEGFKESVKERLGDIRITKSQERFCFEIPPEGVEYVYEHEKDNGFLKEFIETVENPSTALEDILKVFRKFGDGRVICEKSQEEDFDYILFFENPSIDNYRYYIKFHENHVTYHRFLSEDAADMGI
ncbi:MAG: hypothetical protein E7243_10790 [Lacrimispora celerecrescens]|nr:hypothetical protein [Lacrimispora celerecrescens]